MKNSTDSKSNWEYMALISFTIFYSGSSFMYVVINNTEKWFSRGVATIICVGFLYVGRCIKEKK